MRRLLLFTAFLGLLGLSSAFAAGFNVRSDDITTFSTSVSIPPPGPTVAHWYLAGPDWAFPGFMGTDPPSDSSVNSVKLDPGTLPSRFQIDPSRHHSWQSAAAPTGGIHILGDVVARVFQNGNVDVATAGLFSCATPFTLTVLCTQVAGDASSSGDEHAGHEVVIDLGNVDTTVPAGGVLRLVIVNRSSHSWNLQWGYKSNRASRLDVPVVTP